MAKSQGPWATAIREYENELRGEDYESEAVDVPHEKRRVIDWKKVLISFVEVPILGTIAALGIAVTISTIFPDYRAEAPVIAAGIIILAFVLAPVSVAIQLMGTIFNGSKGTLSYPVYVFRRSVPLQSIEAANCQNVTHKSNTSQSARLVGEKGKTYYYKSYVVNLSGGFESRRLVFHSKYKRDQFLAYMRDYVPSCRITRWS